MTVGGEGAGPATLDRFWSIVNGFTAYFAVLAADELGVFGALAEGPARVGVLAERCGADPSRLAALLGGNVAAGTLRCAGGRFSLAPVAAAHLVPGAAGYLGTLLRHSPGPVENWPALAATVRGAPPRREVGRDPGGFLADLVQATYPLQLEVARRVVGSTMAGRLGPAPRVLDVGAGAAPWALAVLERQPDATAVVNDLPAVLPLARRALAGAGLDRRVAFLSGSYWEAELGTGFDMVVLGHVCRAEGDRGAAALVGRAAAALVPGGRLVVTEYLLDDDLRGPPQAQLLGITMVASTARGGTFTRRQARAWLSAAGLELEAEASPLPPTAVLVGRRPWSGARRGRRGPAGRAAGDANVTGAVGRGSR